MSGAPPRKFYGPIGQCIYCGKKDVRLTKEHIVPLGLSGNLTLPKASCERCSDITKKFEQICLRYMFGRFRIKKNMYTRHSKKRPAALPYWTADRSGNARMTLTPVIDTPTSLTLMKFPSPTLLDGKPPVESFFKGDIWIHYDHAEVHSFRKKYGVHSMELGRFKPDPFVQMLAKIGHAFAVAEYGLHSFTPFLPDVIFARTRMPTHWVGGSSYIPPATKTTMHVLQADDDYEANGRHLVIVYIHLFAFINAPTYCVIAGERKVVAH